MRPLEIEMLRQDIRKQGKLYSKAPAQHQPWYQGDDAARLLNVKPANDWLKEAYTTPAPEKLFGSLWFEGELCIMFADTNLGKSVLAVQIGDYLTKGISLQPLNNQLSTGAKVLYVDFELTAKQFESRYINQLNGSYRFDNHFYRAEFNPSAYLPWLHKSYEEFINSQLEQALKHCGARILIIDNITYMSGNTGYSRDALSLMQYLKALKIKLNLSILVLAHTPKRNTCKPISVNDLQGSKMLINFADSAFAMGQSHTQPHLRYLKQIKQRNQEREYGEDNICLIRQKKELNCLKFIFEGHGHEQDHLVKHNVVDKAVLYDRVRALHIKGRSLRQIARELTIHYSTVSRILQQLAEKGEHIE